MRSLELFSGCGGLSMGLSRAGFVHELLVEWNRDAVETVRHNREAGVEHVAHWDVVQADVRGMEFGSFAGRLDLLAGGPPCQGFSIAGKSKGYEDERDMWPNAIRAVREARPRAFAFENVKGLTRPVFADYLAWIVESLRRISESGEQATHVEQLAALRASATVPEYDVRVLRLNAADYGAAQKRHRVVVAGFRSDVQGPRDDLRPTHSRERLLWDQYVDASYWARHGLPAQVVPVADARTVDRLRVAGIRPQKLPWVTLRDAVADLGEPEGKGNHLFQPGARAYPGHTGSPLDQPAKALKAGVHGVPGGENMMVRDDGTVRYFTVREAARLQGLPDDYAFPRSWSESMRQLGNAVPAQLGEAVGRWMAGALRDGAEVGRLAA